MKKLTVLLFPALVLGLLTAGFAYAQTATILRGDIPFEFTVVSRTLPAGSYGVARNSNYPIRTHHSRDREPRIRPSFGRS